MKPPIPLTAPVELPEADIVIFDGNCVFCTGQVQKLARLDGRHRLAFVSLHDPLVADRFPDLSKEQLMEQMYVIPHGTNQRLGGAAAIRYLSRRLPWIWVLAPLLHLPFSLPIWQWFYRQIARRRYRIAGKQGKACDEDGTCHLHYKE